MNHKNLCAALALEQIDFHSNILPGSIPVAKFNADQVAAIDAALADKDTSALDKQISDHAETITTLQASEKKVGEAVKAAYALNGLAYTEGVSSAEAITALSAKCKEYGDSTATHSIPPNDGIDKPDESADPSADYAHNKVFNDEKFKTLK